MSRLSKVPFVFIPKALPKAYASDALPQIRQRLARSRPILITWFLTSCVAGWLHDLRKRSTLELDLVDRQIRVLEGLVGDLKHGKAERDVERELVLVGLRERPAEKGFLETKEERELREAEEESQLPLLKRWFGRRLTDQQREAGEAKAWSDLKTDFGLEPSVPSSPSPSLPASPEVRTSPASSRGTVPFVEGDKRATWAKESFM